MPNIKPRKPTLRAKAARSLSVRKKKPFKLELTAEDIAFDHAFILAAARDIVKGA